MKYRIVIDFEVNNNTLKNSVVFENNPTVYDAIQALDSTLQLFKGAILKKTDSDGISNGISDEKFNEYTKKLTVNKLIDNDGKKISKIR